MFPDTHVTDPPLQNRPQFSSTYNHHHHSETRWNGMGDFRNEVYDAEHLLEELGFAGSLDPTIPERFIPSLLHRVASMPKTAFWYLNQRILHTLILHKRKEQRRRLFRYSSVNNKEIIENRSRVSDLLYSHVAEGGCGKEAGLMRALTGPTDCSERDILSVCLSAFQCPTIPPFGNVPIPNTPAISSSTSTSKPECPIFICIEPPEDQRPMPKDAIGGCVLPDAATKLTNDSRKNESNESLPEIAEDCNLAQAPFIISNIDQRPHQSTIPRSYAKFSKDQRRMVLQRSHAIGRPRSASEPILIPAHSGRNKFLPIAHSLHEEDGIKSPNDATFLPCSSQNQRLSLPHTCNCTSFLRYLHATFSLKVNYLKNTKNIYINIWKRNSRLSGDNRLKELCIERKVERPTLTRQDYVSSISNSSKKFPEVVFSLESDSFKNDIFKLNLPLEFIKLAQTFSSSASEMNSKPVIFFQDGFAIPGSSLRFDMSNLESTVFDCFSILVRRNYLCVAETDNEGGGQTLKKKKSLLAYLSSSQSENSNQKIISKYLLICHNGRDNVKFSYPHHEMLNSKFVALNHLDTPPMLIIAPPMADNFRGRCEPYPVFLSGFNIDIGRNGSNDIRFRSAVTMQFHDTKKSEAGSSIEDAAGNTVEKKAGAERKEPPSHSFFRKATKELIELQEYIKKAKANRESASAELRVLQDILLASNTCSNAGGSSKIKDDDDDKELNTFSEEPVVASKLMGSVPKKHYEKQDGQSPESCIAGTPSVCTENRVLPGADSQTRSEIDKKSVLRQLRKNILRVEQRHCEDVSRMEKELRLVRNESMEDNRRDWNRVDALQLMILQLQNEMLCFQQALSELQKKTRTKEEQTSVPNENEIRSKIQQELEEECNSRVSKMEAKLKVAEQQLRVLREENEGLRQQLLLDSRPNSTHQPTSKHFHTSSPVMNGFAVNGDTTSHVEEKNENEEKLREELQETEERADRLNLMLDEKVVDLNRLQLSLSKRTKEMVLLERAYLQLVCQVYRSGHASRKMNDVSTSPLPNGKLAEEPP